MKRLDLLPLALLVPVLGFVAYQAKEAPRVTATTPGIVAMRATSPAARRAAGSAGASVSKVGERASPASDRAEIRRRLQQGERGTYIVEILRQRDSALARWPNRLERPVRVWVASGAGLKGWDPAHGARVQGAFEEWSRIGIPVRFTFVVDSADSDVKVSWIDHFNEAISGKTLWARDRHWWIVDGAITLALHHNSGEPLDAKAIRAIALHEVGHLLGLDHTADTANIMTPRVRVRDLSEIDRATVRLLYSLPPGSVK